MEVSYQALLPVKAWCASLLDLGPFSCRLGTPKLSPSMFKLIQGVNNERYAGACGLLHFLEERGRGRGKMGNFMVRCRLLGKISFPRFMG